LKTIRCCLDQTTIAWQIKFWKQQKRKAQKGDKTEPETPQENNMSQYFTDDTFPELAAASRMG
jgi:hypothetical protein